LKSVEERFELFKEHEDLWGFLYNQEALPKDLSAHCKDLHIALKEGESSDINGTELEEELKHLKFILPKGQGTPTKTINLKSEPAGGYLPKCVGSFENSSYHTCNCCEC